MDSLDQNQEIRIHKGDRIFIQVTSADPTVTAFLNPFPSTGAGGNNQVGGYLVNSKGEISFPLLGIIKAEGNTSLELTDIIKKKLEVYYKDPYVYVNLTGRVYFMNGRSGTTIPMVNERLTIIEAIVQSGTQDPYDRKNQVWLIREENGLRTFTQLDMNKKEIFKSPYYYLHNNDVVYLKPGKFSFLSSNSPFRTAVTFGGFLITLFFAFRRL